MVVKSILIIAVIVTGSAVAALTTVPQPDQNDNALHVVLPRDAIPAIFNPEFEPAAKARLADHELVIGVVGENEQRAYSIWQLDRHEIVNDLFEGRPIAVTW